MAKSIVETVNEAEGLPQPSLTTVEPATRARNTVLVFAVALAIITYIDRVCISQAAPDIRAALGLNAQQMGWVFSAFTLAYALFEIPAGSMGDKLGPRSVLMKVVLMWSLFTAATGWVWNLISLIVCRFLFGVGEAGCFPNLTKVFTIWLPSNERIRAQGILWLSARWGGAFTPALVAAVLAFIDWRWAFGVFGLLGVAWAIAFYQWFRDDPSTHPAVNAAELALLDGAVCNAPAHAAIPWNRLLTSRSVWLLWLQYFCMSYGWYFYITWLPTYLREARGLEFGESAILAGLPLFFGGIGCFAGGWLAKRLGTAVWCNVSLARRTVSFVGLVGAGAMLVVASQASDATLAIAGMATASFCNDLAMASGWGACMDIGGRHAGSLSGSMNMMGNLGGAVGPVVTGYLLGTTSAGSAASARGWTLALLVTAALYGVGALAWLFVDPVTPLEDPTGSVGL